MKKFLCKVAFVTYFFCSSMASLNAADLHAILVGDYYSADIQQACHIDLKNIRTEVDKIAKNAGFNLQLTVLAGNKSSSQKVINAVKNLQVAKKDVILFYFTGHGYRTEDSGNSPWPNFEFPLERTGVKMKDIIDKIASKGGIFSLVLADCCNIKIPQAYAPPIVKAREAVQVSLEMIKTNYRSLFCQTKGMIAIVSATRGQPSYCNAYGSFYTRSFLRSLREAIESPKADWRDIFDGADDGLQATLKAHKVQQDPVVYTNIK